MKKTILAFTAMAFLIACGEAPKEVPKEEIEVESSTDVEENKLLSLTEAKDSAMTNILMSYKQAVSNGPGQIFKSDSGDMAIFVYVGGYGSVQNTPNVMYDPNTGLGILPYDTCLVMLIDSTTYNAMMFSLEVNKTVETDNLLQCQRINDSVFVSVQNVPVNNRQMMDTMTFIALSPVSIMTKGLGIEYNNTTNGIKEKSKKVFAKSTGESWAKPPINE